VHIIVKTVSQVDLSLNNHTM